MTWAVTLDVGGSHVSAARVDQGKRTIRRLARRDVEHTAPLEELLSAWTGAALDVLEDGAADIGQLGIAVPSPFDTQAGVSAMTHKFAALHGVPLRPLLAERFRGTALDGVPMHFGNDADLFALGEWWAGAGQGSARLIGLTLGTGLGSGFVANGQVVTTGDGVPPDGELWNVPFRDGMAETSACGAALTRAWATQTGESLSAHALSLRARAGDAAAREVFRAFGTTLADLVSPWVRAFRADRLVLGGNVSRAFELFGPSLQAGLAGCSAVVSEHFESAALLGAATLQDS